MTVSPAVITMTSLLPLASILPHPLNLAHVEAPMESITVDSQGVLLAGSHRREEIERLQAATPKLLPNTLVHECWCNPVILMLLKIQKILNGTCVPFSQKGIITPIDSQYAKVSIVEIGLIMKLLE
jgi:hypothetical protein